MFQKEASIKEGGCYNMEFGILGKIYDTIKGIPRTNGAMAVGTFKEKAIALDSVEADITNCVFSIEGKGKLHAAWLAGYTSVSPSLYRWGLKVVIDDEVVFDVQKKSSAESYYDIIETLGFISSGLYSSGTTGASSSSASIRNGRIIPFVAANGYNHGKICHAGFSTTGGSAYGNINIENNAGDFVNGVAQNSNNYMCVIPDNSCVSHTLTGTSSNNGTHISVGSVIPEPLTFNKNIKVYASNKRYSNDAIIRVAYTLEQ